MRKVKIPGVFFIFSFLFLFLISAKLFSEDIPRPEYPRPEMVRTEWLNLNGEWYFAFDFSLSGEERGLPEGEGFDHKIIVPFAPESKLSGIGFPDFIPCVWYKRSFTLPENWSGRKIFLHFEAVDYRATIWLNAKKVGEHEGGFTPFSFDITKFLNPGENILIVRAFDDTRSGRQPAGKQSTRFESYSCFYRRTTGIWQTVWLEPVSDIYIKKYKVFPDIDNKEAHILVFLNQTPEVGKVSLRVTAEAKKKFEAAKKAAELVHFTVPLKDMKLWEIRSPYLYEMEIAFAREKNIEDRIHGYFGMRKIHARGNKIYFNNRPLFLRMVLDQGFYPDGIYTAPSWEDLKRDIEISKGLGFDGARLHQRVFERCFLYWADRLGYLVWGEFADWGLDLEKPESFLVFAKEWTEAVERDFTHPALIGWCPFNERWNEQYPGVMENIFRLTKILDPSRLVIDSSAGYHVVSPDVYDSHNYEQEVGRFKEAFDGLLESPPRVFVNGRPERHAPYEGQPYFVSEYGGIWWNPGQQDEKAWGYGDRPKTPEEFIERYRKLTEALLFNSAVAGFCYTQLYDIEQEVNGLYTFDRKPKFDPEIFRRINQQQAAIEK